MQWWLVTGFVAEADQSILVLYSRVRRMCGSKQYRREGKGRRQNLSYRNDGFSFLKNVDN